MSRKPRYCIEAPYYHVMVQGINKEYILKTDSQKSIYLKIANKCMKEEGIDIIAYCVMGNHTHFLVKSQKQEDLSYCMKRINVAFAKIYNKENSRVGYVFRDRFKAEPIYETYRLHNCIKYIHMNPVKAGICQKQIDYNFSSYKKYCDKLRFIDTDLYNEIFHTKEEYEEVISEKEVNAKKEYYIEEPYSVLELNEWVKRFLGKNNFSHIDIYINKDLLKSIVINMKNECGVSNKEIADFLKINNQKVGRILKEYS